MSAASLSEASLSMAFMFRRLQSSVCFNGQSSRASSDVLEHDGGVCCMLSQWSGVRTYDRQVESATLKVFAGVSLHHIMSRSSIEKVLSQCQ